MCLIIKSVTGAAMLIVFISRTAYATDYCDDHRHVNKVLGLHKTLTESYERFRHDVRQQAGTSSPTGNAEVLSRYTELSPEHQNCCQHLPHMYENTFNNLHRSIAVLEAMDLQGPLFNVLLEQLQNVRNILGYELVKWNHWNATTLDRKSENVGAILPTYATDEGNRQRNHDLTSRIENYIYRDHDYMLSCLREAQKRTVSLRSGINQPKMEARNVPLPVTVESSAADRWEYVARENRAFHQQEGPDRLDRGSVDPLDDLVHQLRVYDELQEVREALKRRDELLVNPVDNDDRREVRAYDQQERPELVAKRNDEFLTDTRAGGAAADNFYENAKRDVETLGPFAESGKRSVRLVDAFDRVREFERALQFLDLHSKK